MQQGGTVNSRSPVFQNIFVDFKINFTLMPVLNIRIKRPGNFNYAIWKLFEYILRKEFIP
jgi:hypothetical protein